MFGSIAKCGVLMAKKADDPTPEEIRAACAEIQAQWTDADFHHRRGFDPGPLQLLPMELHRNGRRLEVQAEIV